MARRWRWALILFAMVLGACIKRPPIPVPAQGTPGYEGPDTVQLDMPRPGPHGPRIFVQATLPDGQLGLFLVDTGAAISALSKDTAKRLGLKVVNDLGYVEGLGGRSAYNQAVIPTLKLGAATLRDVEVAVDVRGVPTRVGALPLDGILGNNVWSRFLLELDYPADTMVLHRPGTFRMPRHSAPMFFDGSHIYAPITITTSADPPHTDRVEIQVDTGASGLMIAGQHGNAFEKDYTVGLEPIFGIGAAELMPPSRFFQMTRRIPVAQVVLGGRTVKTVKRARWINFDGKTPVGPQGLKGLAGHELLAGSDVLIDYQGGRIALRKSHRKARALDANQLLLDQDIAHYGPDPSRALYRARLQVALGHLDKARDLLDGLVAKPPKGFADSDLAEAHVLLAGVLRSQGDLDGAWKALSPLGAGQLVDQDEIVGAVNGLLLQGQTVQAEKLAQQAVKDKPKEVSAYVALSDVRFVQRRWQGADDALLQAARLAQNPDANLLRRARIALAQGDRYGAMADVRRLVQLYPSEGLFLWFYALLIDPARDGGTFRHDMQTAMARLHPDDRPLDFLVAAHTALGDTDEALTLMQKGIDRDCSLAMDDAEKDNCVAWYEALAHHDTDDALRRIDRALAKTGDRSDFLDTKAMVHLARGEYEKAHEAALAAARLSPDDIYMLWQAERLGQMGPHAGAHPSAEAATAAPAPPQAKAEPAASGGKTAEATETPATSPGKP